MINNARNLKLVKAPPVNKYGGYDCHSLWVYENPQNGTSIWATENEHKQIDAIQRIWNLLRADRLCKETQKALSIVLDDYGLACFYEGWDQTSSGTDFSPD